MTLVVTPDVTTTKLRKGDRVGCDRWRYLAGFGLSYLSPLPTQPRELS
jgi:hypothetical protein